MDKKWLTVTAVALPLMVGGLALANLPSRSDEETQQVEDGSFICPLTGEQLPCPYCCPLNESN